MAEREHGGVPFDFAQGKKPPLQGRKSTEDDSWQAAGTRAGRESGIRGGDVMLCALEEFTGLVAKWTVRGDFEISLNIGNNRTRIVEALVDSSQKDVGIGLRVCVREGVFGAAFGLFDAT